MDSYEKSSSGKKDGFFQHVFNFDDDSKAEMLNIIQYAVLAIIPVVILNKLMQRFVPESDDEKGTFEITAEVLAQIIVMFMVMLLIHRIITYIPTYSGEKYAEFSVTSIILAMLVIILSLQTKLGEKVSVLVDRAVELWEGPQDAKNKKGKKTGNVRVSQPISQNQMAMSQSLSSTSISSLPQMQPPQQPQQPPMYDHMYSQDSSGSSGAGMDELGPQPANGGGIGAFGSAFGGW
jgi:hypothetical protein